VLLILDVPALQRAERNGSGGSAAAGVSNDQLRAQEGARLARIRRAHRQPPGVCAVGLLLPAITGKRSLLTVFLVGFALSLAIEAGQLAISIYLGLRLPDGGHR